MLRYVMLRLYSGGGLAKHKIVICKEEDLTDKLAKFEQDCVDSNEGEYLAVLDATEFKRIAKEFEASNNIQVCFNCGKKLKKGKVDYCNDKCKTTVENKESEG